MGEDLSDVVTASAEQGEDGIINPALQRTSGQSAVHLHVTDLGLDGAASFEELRQRRGDAAPLAWQCSREFHERREQRPNSTCPAAIAGPPHRWTEPRSRRSRQDCRRASLPPAGEEGRWTARRSSRFANDPGAQAAEISDLLHDHDKIAPPVQRPAQQQFTRRGQLHLTRQPVEQARAQHLFGHQDLPVYGRGRDVEKPRCFADRP